MRKHHELIQGSPEWHQFRAEHGGASEAAAMLNVSPYTARSELMRFKSTGIAKDVGAVTQRVFDRGHVVEALARPIIEATLDEDLYPVTVSRGYLSASCDGLTMDESIAWECKQYNAKLFESVSAGILPEHHVPQCQQVLYVTGAEKLIFTCSDGNEENTVSMVVYPDKKQQELLVSGWEQFRKDLSEYVPPVIVETPQVEAVIDLPAVIVQVKGELTLCNIADIRPAFDKFLSEATVELITDNDFAQAEAESKVGREVAKKCLATAKGVIDQTASISEVTRELEQYAAKFNALALSQEKAVKTQKEARKLAIMTASKEVFSEHISKLEAEIKPIRLVTGQPNFPEAMKNKRLLSAIQDGVDAELARVKIEADATARLIRVNLNLMTEYAPYQFLFNDLCQIIYKPFDDLKLLVLSRIAEHERREAENLETQRLQIEAEAKCKAEAEQAAKLEAERAKVRAEEQAKITEERRLERVEFDKRQESERLSERELHRENTPLPDRLNVAPIIEPKLNPVIKGGNPSLEMVTISRSEYNVLVGRVAWLKCLEEAGVENWDGIDYATALLDGTTAEFHNA